VVGIPSHSPFLARVSGPHEAPNCRPPDHQFFTAGGWVEEQRGVLAVGGQRRPPTPSPWGASIGCCLSAGVPLPYNGKVAGLASVEGLEIGFPRPPGGVVRVVRGGEFAVTEGDSVALVGESGCGKTLSALALTNLVPEPGRIVGGRVVVDGEEVRGLSEARLQRLRGAVVGYLWQEPGMAFNPLLRVGVQVAEAGVLRYGWSRRQADCRAVELLRAVGLENAEALAAGYPHQLSGGQRQRALLAAALAGDPRLLVLDEPTSALDPLAQQSLLELIGRVQKARGLAVLLITHDLQLAARVARRVVVMYAGETVESAPTQELLAAPAHPYTQALLYCAITPPGGVPRPRGEELATIPGRVPPPEAWGGVCRFAPRCDRAMARCRTAHPALTELTPERRVRCFLHAGAEDGGG